METHGVSQGHGVSHRAPAPRVVDALLLVGCVATTTVAALSRAPELPPLSDWTLRLTGVFAAGAIYLVIRTGPRVILAWGWALVTLGLVHGAAWSFVAPTVAATMTQRALLFIGIPLAGAGVFLTRRSILHLLESTNEVQHETVAREHCLKQLFEDATLGCLITDQDGTILLANRPAHAVLGRAPNTLVGYRLDDLGMHAEPNTGGRDRGCVEVRYRHPDGTERELELCEKPVQRMDGSVEGYATWLSDVTSRNQNERERDDLKAQTRQNERLETIGTLTGGIAHDFNNLLAPIIGSTELARMDLAEDSPILEDLDLIRTAADRAKDLATQLLRLSRPERDQVKAVSLQEILREALALLRASMGNTIGLVEHYDPECPMVLATRTQIHQVLFNLCKNAFHAMPAGGTLTVFVESAEALATTEELPPGEGPFARVRITDSGIGMDGETVDRIFDPFFTTKDEQSGTGLGLAMAKSIVTNFRGTISVESAVGHGTTFTVMFPACRESSVSDPQAPDVSLVGSGHILLVDDEEAVLRVTARGLWKLGYEVSPYRSSSDALGAFLENPYAFDLVLTDLTMPDLTGLELLDRVRTIRADLPMVLTTGWVDRVPQEELERLGCELLPKPASPSELSQAISQSLRCLRAERPVPAGA